jgi:hypothetical protein
MTKAAGQRPLRLPDGVLPTAVEATIWEPAKRNASLAAALKHSGVAPERLAKLKAPRTAILRIS